MFTFENSIVMQIREAVEDFHDFRKLGRNKKQEKSVREMSQIFHSFCTRASDVFPECEWARLI